MHKSADIAFLLLCAASLWLVVAWLSIHSMSSVLTISDVPVSSTSLFWYEYYSQFVVFFKRVG